MNMYFSYHPTEFYFNGYVFGDTAPENSTDIPVPACTGEMFAKWNGEKWVVKELVDGEWIDSTKELPTHGQNDGRVVLKKETSEQPAIEGEINGEQI